MTRNSPRLLWRALGALCCCYGCLVFSAEAKTPPPQASQSTQDSSQKSIEQGPAQRIPRQQAQNTAAVDGVVRDTESPNKTHPIPGAVVTLRNLQSGRVFTSVSSSEGV